MKDLDYIHKVILNSLSKTRKLENIAHSLRNVFEKYIFDKKGFGCILNFFSFHSRQYVQNCDKESRIPGIYHTNKDR